MTQEKQGRKHPNLHDIILDLMEQENMTGLEKLFGRKVVFWKPEDSEHCYCSSCHTEIPKGDTRYKLYDPAYCQRCHE